MKLRALFAAILALCIGVLSACSSEPTAVLNNQELTYDQILNTGLANNCPQLPETARGSIDIGANQSFTISDLCLQPQEVFVKEEPINKREEAKFVAGKILTRDTTSLEQIRATLDSDANGLLKLVEIDGLDFQPITVLLPGGEEVPFLFTIKQLVASSLSGVTTINTSTDLAGNFVVPSYRGNVFLDPKGRGVASGYDNAVALPSQADKSELVTTNVKRLDKGTGSIALEVTKVDPETGEVAGIFESNQPSDTDLGAKEPLDVKIKGVFYARLEPKA